MYRLRPVANGTSTDHPVPGLPFINDNRLPLDNPDAIERTGRNQGEGLWGRTDSTEHDGWVAFTTEPKNPSFAWAVYYHPIHGRTVLLIRDEEQSDLHYVWKYGRTGFLHRHGGYWWNGEHWHRPAQVRDAAYESYDPRLVDNPTTITAADLLDASSAPERATTLKIASFSEQEPVSNWTDHLALWAQQRAAQSDRLPLDACIVDFDAPELAAESLVGMEGLAKIAGISMDDLPNLEYGGRRELPEPQHEDAGRMRWAVPVARDWAENYRRDNGPAALLSATTVYDTVQPAGLVADHDRLRSVFHKTLTEERRSGRKKQAPYLKGALAQEAADELAWDAAASLMYGHNQGLIPHAPLRDVLIDSILGRLAEDVERGDAQGKSRQELLLSDMPTGAVQLLTWYIQHRPGDTAGLFGAICLRARVESDLHPAKVGSLFRRSLSLDSGLDGKTIDTLLDMALPPSAHDYRRR